ncbi:MAG: hypothetical protein KDG52_18170 [Rhodocyclaceae bacterium]|nr:hypothetical protein [Rhodocyclaceae bacterium]
MRELLTFEQAPPFSVPLRFLLTAIPFAMAAGLLLALSGDALATRWSRESLAITHLMTAGFMLQAMCGALMQLTPVAIGANLPRPRLLAWLVHPPMTIGGICLAAGLFLHSAPMLTAGGLAVALSALLLAAAALTSLARTPARNHSRQAMRIALVGLVFTVILGLALALARAGFELPATILSVAAHLRVGWLLWGLTLLCAASFMVVPMFQMTPAYPEHFQRWFPPLLALAVVAAASGIAAPLGDILVCALAAGYAGLTLRLQQRRRRPRTDASFAFWRIALASTMLAAALAPALGWMADPTRAEVLLGALVLLGGFDSVICAMIYKIVPFLVWLHLSRAGAPPLLMHQVIPESTMRLHLRIHAAALLFSLPAPWWPPCAAAAGLLLFAGHSVQAVGLAGGLRRYLRHRGMEQGAA